jgi:hypothetical protein
VTEPRIAHPCVGLFLRHTMIASYDETTSPNIRRTFGVITCDGHSPSLSGAGKLEVQQRGIEGFRARACTLVHAFAQD